MLESIILCMNNNTAIIQDKILGNPKVAKISKHDLSNLINKLNEAYDNIGYLISKELSKL